MKKAILPTLLCLFCFSGVQLSAQFPFKGKWVDSVYQTLNEQERIGQLFMVAAYSGGANKNQEEIDQLLTKHQIGGLIFMQGTPEEQARLTNRYQQKAQVPLLIGMDAEWGLGMRLTGVRNFPRQMMIGATRDTALMYDMGAAIAAQCKRLGVHINFAPDIDVNNNPKNPVINFRSFGEDKAWVSRLGIAYMKGLQDHGVMACAKHFPGHGDVETDSHLDLPVVNKSRQELNQMELYPFKQLINAGIQSIMIAHLSIPALDPTPNLPTTLSHKVVTGLLREEMGYHGLIFTDALNMKGVTKHYPDGETDLMAFLAGNDVLLFAQNVPLAIQKIQWALKTGKVSQEELERRVKKILSAKYDAGLANRLNIKTEGVTDDLNSMIDKITDRTAKAAVTLVKNEAQLLNRTIAGKGKLAYLNVHGQRPVLQGLLRTKYPDIKLLELPAKSTAASKQALIKQLAGFDAVIIGVHDMAWYPGKQGFYGLSQEEVAFLSQMAGQKNVIFAVMGNPYLLKFICPAATVIVAYEENKATSQAVVDVLSGKQKAGGQLPVQACK